MLYSQKINLNLQLITDLVKKHSKNGRGLNQKFIKYYFQKYPNEFIKVWFRHQKDIDAHKNSKDHQDDFKIKDVRWFDVWRFMIGNHYKDYGQDDMTITSLQIFVRDILFTAGNNPKFELEENAYLKY